MTPIQNNTISQTSSLPTQQTFVPPPIQDTIEEESGCSTLCSSATRLFIMTVNYITFCVFFIRYISNNHQVPLLLFGGYPIDHQINQALQQLAEVHPDAAYSLYHFHKSIFFDETIQMNMGSGRANDQILDIIGTWHHDLPNRDVFLALFQERLEIPGSSSFYLWI